jgi:hypothetical protein
VVLLCFLPSLCYRQSTFSEGDFMVRQLIVLASVLVYLGACGDSGVVKPTDVNDVQADTVVAVDTSIQEDTLSTADTINPPDQSSNCEPGEGCFNEPCAGPDDCNSGICTMHLGEKVCSKTCDSTCPEGWTCQLVSGGSDGQYVCMSNYASLCLPCESAEGTHCVREISRGIEILWWVMQPGNPLPRRL